MMESSIIQDWTETEVPMKYGPSRHVRYRVYRQDDKRFQEICEGDDRPVQTLELPSRMALEKTSYEVLLRYALADVVIS